MITYTCQYIGVKAKPKQHSKQKNLTDQLASELLNKRGSDLGERDFEQYQREQRGEFGSVDLEPIDEQKVKQQRRVEEEYEKRQRAWETYLDNVTTNPGTTHVEVDIWNLSELAQLARKRMELPVIPENE